MNPIYAMLFIVPNQGGEGGKPERQRVDPAPSAAGLDDADQGQMPSPDEAASQLGALRQQLAQLQQEAAAYRDALERTEAQMESTDKENDALREALNLMRLPMDLRNYAIDLASGVA
ncbi:hypothetical protein [Chromobacterium sp. IIBBL 290-4]|uniref:hypothetical protein n=1 Tax=Chromobacterium sp. IIBBL 290-4 TaxID=2953890 RepID=UPI0020B6F423|nr:hypothetical protein [Chromobacterium sp. IIBBL 290-4]UTH73746.1 hypothetical protein NKT35_19715 [Chromobacterium sp. IIBBL 290-4]